MTQPLRPAPAGPIPSPEFRGLAPYACKPWESRGRLYAEEEAADRSPFQRDRDRVIHSTAFRRLKHKTQVFVYHEGDHYRTRLTHSLEVSQIARTISRQLGLNEDLAEALALAHDLGHTPFGHAGEEALHSCMKEFGGFDHNAQTLRILTKLEQRYAAFDGLNLTWESLEGVVKHNGPLLSGSKSKDFSLLAIPIQEFNQEFDLELTSYASCEAQVAALSDDIAYNNHDIDDGLRAGLFGPEDLAEVPLVGPVFAEIEARYPGLDRSRLIHEAVRKLISLMVGDLLAETRRRLAAHKPGSADAVRHLGQPIVSFSEEMQAHDKALKAFLFKRMYRHYKVTRMTTKAKRVVRDLFGEYFKEPDCLPPEWLARTDGVGTARTARVVADYIAGMTDGYALREHERQF